MRAVLRGGETVGGDVVDFFLTVLHARRVVRQADALLIGVGLRRGKAQQFGDALFVPVVLADAFFEHAAEFLPEGRVFLFLVFRQVLEQAEHLVHATLADGLDIL